VHIWVVEGRTEGTFGGWKPFDMRRTRKEARYELKQRKKHAVKAGNNWVWRIRKFIPANEMSKRTRQTQIIDFIASVDHRVGRAIANQVILDRSTKEMRDILSRIESEVCNPRVI